MQFGGGLQWAAFQTNNNLYRAQIQSAPVVSDTTEIIGWPGIDGRNRDNDKDLLAFLSADMFVSDGKTRRTCYVFPELRNATQSND